MFRRPVFVAQLSFRYLIDTRWAIYDAVYHRVAFGQFGRFRRGVSPEGRYSFRSQIYDLGCRAEFNFFSYGIGETYKRLRRWSPYMALGVGGDFRQSRRRGICRIQCAHGFRSEVQVRPRLNIAAGILCYQKYFPTISTGRTCRTCIRSRPRF